MARVLRIPLPDPVDELTPLGDRLAAATQAVRSIEALAVAMREAIEAARAAGVDVTWDASPETWRMGLPAVLRVGYGMNGSAHQLEPRGVPVA